MIENVMMWSGLFLFVVGGSGLDSEQMAPPVVMCLAGALLLYVAAKSRSTLGRGKNGRGKTYTR